MSIEKYEYPINECDVPKVRHGALKEYRTFRRKCLEYIRGESDTSVMDQVHNLAWHTAVFRTLNEARRIESNRSVNGALWELTTAGYVSLMVLGIRKLVEKPKRSDTGSIYNVITRIERRPELMTREMFVCYDGLPYDYEKVKDEYIQSLDTSNNHLARWMPNKGPKAWSTSESMHKAFDSLAGNPQRRKRTDAIDLSILDTLKNRLSHSAIEKVCTLADKRFAHAERISERSEAIPSATFNDIDTAMQQIVCVADFLSTSFFYDAAFGSVVPTPQFNVLEALDQPWVTTSNLEALNCYWYEQCELMDNWVNAAPDDFLPTNN